MACSKSNDINITAAGMQLLHSSQCRFQHAAVPNTRSAAVLDELAFVYRLYQVN